MVRSTIDHRPFIADIDEGVLTPEPKRHQPTRPPCGAPGVVSGGVFDLLQSRSIFEVVRAMTAPHLSLPRTVVDLMRQVIRDISLLSLQGYS